MHGKKVASSTNIKQVMEEDIARLKKQVKEWHDTKPDTWGFTTEIAEINAITGGLVPDELMILAGAPGSGKTSLGIQLTESVARQTMGKKKDFVHVIVSAEMSRRVLYMRSACRLAGVDSLLLRRGKISQSELDKFMSHLDELQKLPILIIDGPGMTSQDVVTMSRILTDEGLNLGVVCVDYLQRLADDGEDISRISRIMQNLGNVKGETGCCMLVMSQYTREKEKAGRPPLLQDLFGGSRIENDADQVLALHYPRPADRFDPGITTIDVQVHVIKNRNGKLGIIDLAFNKTHTKFSAPIVGKKV